jgi:uncharacterized protein YjbJ (UPF0337 family)
MPWWIIGRKLNCSRNQIPEALVFTPIAQRNSRRRTMNWDRVSGNWKQFRGKVKEQWGKLTDDELNQIAGNREQLEGKIQEHYGIAKDAVKKQVDEAMRRW